MDKLVVLIQIAFRNLFASRVNYIIGSVMLGGTALVVVGSSLLDSVDTAMSRSIRSSVAGDLQVYSPKSKDELALFGNMGSEADLAPIDDYEKMVDVVSKVPNVKAIVPMGINSALVTGGNTVDLLLADLREAVKNKSERRASLEAHVQQILKVLSQDRKRMDALRKKTKEDFEADEAVAKASSDEFWQQFVKDPFNGLEFLENRVAPQVGDSNFVFLRYVGTDLEAFQQSFDRMQIVDGSAVPPGHRGFLFNKRVYEDQLKMKNAWRLDRIKESIDADKPIATDATMQRYVKECKTQTREIVLQLDGLKTKQAVDVLQKGLNSKTAELEPLLTELFDLNDDNFNARYKLFYDGIAPMLQLYRLRIGDVLTIKAFTRSGYVQSVNVRIYGTFIFKGLEKAGLSGAINLMDMMSFRTLLGYLTADKMAEIEAIKQTAGAKQVDRANAEDELFGGDTRTVVADATPGIIDENKIMGGVTGQLQREDLTARVFSKEDIRKGLVLNAAIHLNDSDDWKKSAADIEAAAKAAGIELRVVSWQKAAGLIGQFVLVAKLALYFAVFIIFIVVLVIINNAVMMATLQRVREIGTMRAIGSQRPFVLAMILVETIVLGIVFGGAGVLIGSLIMTFLHSVGIPAGNEQLYFFFSGPRLYPVMHLGNIVVAFVIVLIVCAISTLYPAFLAARISPLRAMQTDE